MTTILVIDDDESLRDTIGIMLEQEGFSPILVADGKTGFERALSVKPDLMLVDLRLPGMNGTEICKQIRAANMKTPIIVLSAIGEEVDKVLLARCPESCAVWNHRGGFRTARCNQARRSAENDAR
jgi:DNA-binding response OmpR family regulator